jgi:DNA-binding winged helix-turn-helix (wHTH) protein
VPETKEDITKAVWKGKKKTKKALEKTYPNIAHLFDKIGLLKTLSEEV